MTGAPIKQGGSCILTYHSLDTSGSVISIPPKLFRQQMEWLAATRVAVVPLGRVRETTGAVAITFDDGFHNFFEHAAPVLQEFGFPATVFVVSDFCGGANDWPTQPRTPAVPKLELMPWSELQQIAKAGISIGCHTATHPYLSRLNAAELEEELARSRSAIEQRVGMAVETFAYPYGDATAQVREAAGRHFQLACGTRMAFLSADSDLLDLPRLDVYYLRSRFWFHGLQRPYGAAYVAARGGLRLLRQGLIFKHP